MKWFRELKGLLFIGVFCFGTFAVMSTSMGDAAKAVVIFALFAAVVLAERLMDRRVPGLAEERGWLEFDESQMSTGRPKLAWLVELVSGLGQFAVIMLIMVMAMIWAMTTGSIRIFVYWGAGLAGYGWGWNCFRRWAGRGAGIAEGGWRTGKCLEARRSGMFATGARCARIRGGLVATIKEVCGRGRWRAG